MDHFVGYSMKKTLLVYFQYSISYFSGEFLEKKIFRNFSLSFSIQASVLFLSLSLSRLHLYQLPHLFYDFDTQHTSRRISAWQPHTLAHFSVHFANAFSNAWLELRRFSLFRELPGCLGWLVRAAHLAHRSRFNRSTDRICVYRYRYHIGDSC